MLSILLFYHTLLRLELCNTCRHKPSMQSLLESNHLQRLHDNLQYISLYLTQTAGQNYRQINVDRATFKKCFKFRKLGCICSLGWRVTATRYVNEAIYLKACTDILILCLTVSQIACQYIYIWEQQDVKLLLVQRLVGSQPNRLLLVRQIGISTPWFPKKKKALLEVSSRCECLPIYFVLPSTCATKTFVEDVLPVKPRSHTWSMWWKYKH